MEKWNKVTLSEICDLVAGFAFKSKDFGDYDSKVIKITHITPPSVDMDNLSGVDISKYNATKLAKYVAQAGDYVLAMTGATIGKIGRVEHGSAYINQRVLLFKPRPSVDKEYLYYALQQYEFTQYIISHVDSESAQPNISAGTIGKYQIVLPPIETQKKIGAILRAYDEKCEKNRKINDNLQQQAQAIYASMFLDDPTLETTAGTLKDVADITMGQSPSGSSYNEDGYGEVFYQGRAEFGYRFPTRRLYTTEPKRMAEAGDVLLSVRAPVGDLNVAYERCCIGRGLGAIHSRNGYQSFVLYTMFALCPQLDVYNGEGTVFGSINRNALNDMPIDIPSEDAIAAFEAVVRPMDDMIRSNYEENCRLQELRDSLLPQLMSGEVDVSNIDI